MSGDMQNLFSLALLQAIEIKKENKYEISKKIIYRIKIKGKTKIN